MVFGLEPRQRPCKHTVIFVTFACDENTLWEDISGSTFKRLLGVAGPRWHCYT